MSDVVLEDGMETVARIKRPRGASTALAVTGHIKTVKVGEIVKLVPTSEWMRITDVKDDVLTVERAIGGTSVMSWPRGWEEGYLQRPLPWVQSTTAEEES